MWCGICGYLHVKCSSLKNKKDSKKDFVCVNCEPSSQILPQPQIFLPPDLPLTPGNFWNMMTTELCQKLKIVFGEIVNWRPNVFTLKKNKTGHAFIDTLHPTLSALLDRSQDALLIVMVMHHLVLSRTKSENDGSQNQTLTRLLEMWLN